MTLIGQTLTHYRIVAAIGAGGMGEVYRATDTNLQRDVAIKVLPHAFAADPERIGGGTAPVWSAAGDEIFFLCGPKLLAAPIRADGDQPLVGAPRVLFENRRVLAFDAARDGKRFLVAEDPNPAAQPRLDLVVHWTAEVQRKVAEARTP